MRQKVYRCDYTFGGRGSIRLDVEPEPADTATWRRVRRAGVIVISEGEIDKLRQRRERQMTAVDGVPGYLMSRAPTVISIPPI